jgi:hypothetical protein
MLGKIQVFAGMDKFVCLWCRGWKAVPADDDGVVAAKKDMGRNI